MARLKHLPIEVRARICEFIGNIADAPSDYQPDPRELDNFFLLDKDDSPFSVFCSIDSTPIGPRYSSIYKDLRSLALASKTFTDSAQRVLFRIAVVGGPRCVMRLLKSLLLYPKNRRHIRSLFVTRKGFEWNLAEEVLAQFKQELRPLVLTRTIDELYDASFFRGFETGLLFEDSRPNGDRNYIARGFSTMLLLKFEDHVLRAIIQLCPFLSGFHICCGKGGFDVHALARTKVPASLDDGPSNTFPQLKSLTLDYNALLVRVDSIAARPRYPGGCPPNIERLTLLGPWLFSNRSGQPISLSFIHSWIRSNTSLKELRVINGFDYRVECPDEEITTIESIPTWNTILHLFKDTLKLLVFDGYHSRFGDSKDRFGPTRMLSLEDFEKLAYLTVPLYMLRRDGRTLRVPKEGQKVLDLVRTKFPKGLKKVDIVVFESSGSFESLSGVTQNFIAPIKTSKVRLIEAITSS